MKNYDQTNNHHIQCIVCKHSVRNKMSQKMPVDGFKWKNNKLGFAEKFIKK